MWGDLSALPARRSSAEVTQLGDRTLISTLNPSVNEDLLEQLSKQGATAFALDCIPRMLSRGQTFDVPVSRVRFFPQMRLFQVPRTPVGEPFTPEDSECE